MSKAETQETEDEGRITNVSGPVVEAKGLDARMNDVVRVGEEELMGEVIEIEGEVTTIQVYEETSGISPGEPIYTTGAPLSVELGPGVLDSIYDGVQRPLDILEKEMGDFLDRGVDAPGIDLDREWEFTPEVEEGDEVSEGEVIGTVPETESIEHKVMVPPGEEGTVAETMEGEYTVEDTVVVLEDGTEITMLQEWPVRKARPVDEKQTPTTPLVTGQRILDTLFPIAKGGTAAIPGPFGSGKTVTQHQLGLPRTRRPRDRESADGAYVAHREHE
jgi:V/A-type H+-transporting ATPase subunit A